MGRTGELDPKLWPEVRGLVLRYVYRRERKHEPVKFAQAWAFVRADGYRITQQDLETVLEDLREEGFLKFTRHEDERTGYIEFREIRTTQRGRNLIERTANDPSVRIELSGACDADGRPD